MYNNNKYFLVKYKTDLIKWIIIVKFSEHQEVESLVKVKAT